jgi:enoyl-CoA hydratase/carnithine racemase
MNGFDSVFAGTIPGPRFSSGWFNGDINKIEKWRGSDMVNNDILFKVENGIATITLNQPKKKNAFNMGMIERWAQALVTWRIDPEVKVIILTGAGDAFCSGVDLGSNTNRDAMGAYDHKSVLWDKIHRIALALEDLDKPVIAAVNGVAVGAGLDMALMCDIRFASDTARMAEGYVKVGLVPGDGGCYYLPRLVGIAKALELFFTGEFVDAQEALRIGMVNRVYPADKLMDETYAYARKIADGPSLIIQTIKRATYQSSRTDLRTALDLVSSHMGVIRSTEDHRRTMAAAMERLKGKA